MHPRCYLIALASSAFALAGCATTTPETDARFGEATMTLKASQSIDPAAALTNANKSTNGMPGQAASNGIDRYYKSFSAPPAPMNIINVGAPTVAPASH